MYMYMYVYIYIYMYMCVYIYICIYIYIYIYRVGFRSGSEVVLKLSNYVSLSINNDISHLYWHYSYWYCYDYCYYHYYYHYYYYYYCYYYYYLYGFMVNYSPSHALRLARGCTRSLWSSTSSQSRPGRCQPICSCCTPLFGACARFQSRPLSLFPCFSFS